ncbi:hypothetical protein GCM10009000_048300 [Halobacterium noricense]
MFSTPDTGVSSLGPLGLVGTDKWYHAIGYGVLATLLAIALSGRVDESNRPGEANRANESNRTNWATSAIAVALVAIAGATGFGILIEIAQTFVPVRHGGIGDATANAFGATVAVTIRFLVARRDEGDLRS